MSAAACFGEILTNLDDHRSRKHDDPSLRPNKKARAEPRPSQLSQDNFARRSFLEQQTALSLIQFSNEQKDLNLSSDQVENLLGALIVSTRP